MSLALAQVGLGSRVAFTCTLFNVQHGPFQKSGFHKLLVEVASDVSETFDANDPVLVHFFPKILHDRKFDSSLNSSEERQKYLDNLPQEPFLKSKGPKASMSRFNSWTHAFHHLDDNWHSFAFLLVVTSLLNGWSKFADEFWAPAELINDKLAMTAPPPSAPSSSSAGPVAPAPVSGDAPAGAAAERSAMTKAQAKLEAKRELEALRAKSVNTLHAMARAVCDPDVLTETRIIGYWQLPEAIASGRMLQDLRSAEDRMFSNGGLDIGVKYVVKLLSGISEANFINRLLLDMSQPFEPHPAKHQSGKTFGVSDWGSRNGFLVGCEDSHI